MKRNITVSLDENVARWARVKAAEKDTSVSRLLAEELERQMREESDYEQAQERFLNQSGRRLRSENTLYPDRSTLYER